MIFRRYLWREVSVASLTTLAVTVLVFAAHRLTRLLETAASGEIPGTWLLKITALIVAARLEILLPLACFAGALLAVSRLRADGELDAMLSVGVAPGGITRTLLVLALVVATITTVCAFMVSPKLRAQTDALIASGRAEALVSAIAPGRFAPFRAGDRAQGVLMAEEIDPGSGRLGDVFIGLTEQRDSGPLEPSACPSARRSQVQDANGSSGCEAQEAVPQQQVLRAATARLETDASGARFLVLEDGWRYAGQPGEPDYVATRFATHAVRLDLLTSPPRDDIDSVPTESLLGSPNALTQPETAALLQWRASMPIAALLLAAMVVPIVRAAPPRLRYVPLVLGVLAFVVYFNVLGVLRAMVEKSDLPPWPGILWGHAAVAALLLALPLVARMRRRQAR